MARDVRAYLWDVERSASFIELLLGGQTFQEYEQDELLRAGVEQMFGIIGEALSLLGIHHPEALLALPTAKRYIGLRNVLAHRYIDTDDRVIWDTAQKDLPLLRSEIATLLATLKQD